MITSGYYRSFPHSLRLAPVRFCFVFPLTSWFLHVRQIRKNSRLQHSKIIRRERGSARADASADEAVYWLTDMPLQFFVGFNTHEAGKRWPCCRWGVV